MKNKVSKILTLLLSVTLLLGLTACGNKSTSNEAGTTEENAVEQQKESENEGENQSAEPVKLMVSITATNTDDNPTGRSLQVFKDKVEEVSNGALELECYWGATLYAQDAETAAVTSGDVFMTYSGSSWLTDGSPWVSMFASGYFFKDVDHMNAVLNGEIGQEVYQKIADDQGILPLGAIYTGSRAISLSTDKKVESRADLEGVNLRMANSESWMFMGEALGANPTAINYSDLYLALSTGTADGQDNPIAALVASSFYEVQKSVTLTGHVVDSVWPTVNKAQWDALTEEQQGWIMEGFKAARDYCENANLNSDEETIAFLEENGLTVYTIDTTKYAQEVQEYYLSSDMVKNWDMDLYEQIQSLEY